MTKRCPSAVTSRALGEQGQPEVHDGHVALVVDDKVARFDVAVDNAFFVRGFEAFPDLLGDVENVGNLQGRGLDAFVEAFAFDEGHCEERLLVDFADLTSALDTPAVQWLFMSKVPAPAATRSVQAHAPIDKYYAVRNLVLADFHARYRTTAAGALWSLINPLIMMGVLTFVFSVIFEGTRELFPLFLLAGLLPFDFFAQAWQGGTISIFRNASLVKSFPFRAELLPLSAVLASFVHYAIQLSLLLLAYIWFVGVNIYWLWLPLIVALQVLFACGFSMASSALDVRYRDVRYVVESATLVLFWLVPIFYGLDQVSPKYTWLYELNPVAAVVLVMRRVLLHGTAPGYTLLKLLAVSILCFVGGYWIFQRNKRDFADYL